VNHGDDEDGSQSNSKPTDPSESNVATDSDPIRFQSRWPTTDELRERLTREMHTAMSNEEFILIPAPTSSGKSYNGATTPWRDIEAAGNKPVIHLHYTTDSRDEAVEDSKEAGIEYRELLGRKEACPIVNGDHDTGEDKVTTPTGEPASEWFQRQLNKKGDTLSHAHSYLENEVDENDGELPCSPCKSIEQWEGIPYDEDGNVSADVIHATHMFAYVPSLSDDTNLFFDERPDFTTSIGERDNDGMTVGRFQEIVTAWLEYIDAPVLDWEDFVVTSKQNEDDRLREAISEDRAVDGEWLINDESAHALAPALTEAMYDALRKESDRNGRQKGESVHISHRLSEDGQHRDPRHNRSRITLIIGENNRPLVYWNVPELGTARSIICLDAWPSIYEWKLNIGTNLTYREIVPTDKFEKWRKFERGLEVVQVGESARPASSDHAVENYVDSTRQKTVIDKLRQEHGADFNSIIYPKILKDQMPELLPEGFQTMTLGNVEPVRKTSPDGVKL
jgi:hypothetical protein